MYTYTCAYTYNIPTTSPFIHQRSTIKISEIKHRNIYVFEMENLKRIKQKQEEKLIQKKYIYFVIVISSSSNLSVCLPICSHGKEYECHSIIQIDPHAYHVRMRMDVDTGVHASIQRSMPLLSAKTRNLLWMWCKNCS